MAAFLVLFSHCFPLGGRYAQEPLARATNIDSLGGVGVSIFFVLSGYMVALSVERSRNLPDFARRRILRIYPALIVVVLASVLVLGPLLTIAPLDAYFGMVETRLYLLNAGGWTVEHLLPGVFMGNPLAHSVNGSLWTLHYELTCYLMIGVLCLLPAVMRGAALRWLAPVVVLVLAIVLLLRPMSPPADPLQKFLWLDMHHCRLCLLFAMGAAFAAWRGKAGPSGWLGAALLVIALFMPGGTPQQLVWQLGLGLCALWLALYGRWLPRIPARMGDWSYGFYLYAFPVQQAFAREGLHEWNFAVYIAACTAATLVLAGLSWHFVEKPALRWKAAGGATA